VDSSRTVPPLGTSIPPVSTRAGTGGSATPRAGPGARAGQSPAIRVIIAEDHPLMLEAMLRRLDTAGVDVVAVASNGEELVSAYDHHRPDVVLTDHAMPRLSGLDAVRRIVDRDPDAKIVVLTAYEDPALVTAAVRAGAIGFLAKRLTGSDLVGKITAAANGEPTFDDNALAVVFGEMRRPTPNVSVLSRREREVLGLVALGLSNTQIAARLFIGVQTVKTHVTNVCHKLGVSSRAAAVRRGTELQLL